MNNLAPEIFKQLSQCIDRGIYDKNIEILANTKYFKKLYKQAKYNSYIDYINSDENIPRALENYLVVDFEKKRTLICDILFSIHQEYPRVFTLSKYLDATKCIFEIITQYQWATQDLSFVLKIVASFMYLRLQKIPQDGLIQIIKRFQNYGPWSDKEILPAFGDKTFVNLLQKNRKKVILEKIQEQQVTKISRFKKILMKFGFIKHIPS